MPDNRQALRYNAGKPDMTYLLSASYALEGAAEVMRYGDEKYTTRDEEGNVVETGRNNWKRGLSLENCLASLTRHMVRVLEGEQIDPESGLPHLDHLLCNAIFAAYFYNGRKAANDARKLVEENS
jgi:hypothetical protein